MNPISTQSLPQTGETHSFMGIIGLLLSSVLLFFLILKRKILKKMGIVLIFIVGILSSGVLLVHAESDLLPQFQKTFQKAVK